MASVTKRCFREPRRAIGLVSALIVILVHDNAILRPSLKMVVVDSIPAADS